MGLFYRLWFFSWWVDHPLSTVVVGQAHLGTEFYHYAVWMTLFFFLISLSVLLLLFLVATYQALQRARRSSWIGAGLAGLGLFLGALFLSFYYYVALSRLLYGRQMRKRYFRKAFNAYRQRPALFPISFWPASAQVNYFFYFYLHFFLRYTLHYVTLWFLSLIGFFYHALRYRFIRYGFFFYLTFLVWRGWWKELWSFGLKRAHGTRWLSSWAKLKEFFLGWWLFEDRFGVRSTRWWSLGQGWWGQSLRSAPPRLSSPRFRTGRAWIMALWAHFGFGLSQVQGSSYQIFWSLKYSLYGLRPDFVTPLWRLGLHLASFYVFWLLFWVDRGQQRWERIFSASFYAFLVLVQSGGLLVLFALSGGARGLRFMLCFIGQGGGRWVVIALGIVFLLLAPVTWWRELLLFINFAADYWSIQSILSTSYALWEQLSFHPERYVQALVQEEIFLKDHISAWSNYHLYLEEGAARKARNWSTFLWWGWAYGWLSLLGFKLWWFYHGPWLGTLIYQCFYFHYALFYYSATILYSSVLWHIGVELFREFSWVLTSVLGALAWNGLSALDHAGFIPFGGASWAFFFSLPTGSKGLWGGGETLWLWSFLYSLPLWRTGGTLSSATWEKASLAEIYSVMVWPEYDYFYAGSTPVLERHWAYDPFWQVKGFYSRARFDDYAFMSREARWQRKHFHVSPFAHWHLHDISRSLKISDYQKILIMFDFFEHYYRRHVPFTLALNLDNNFHRSFLTLAPNIDSAPWGDISTVRRRQRHRTNLIQALALSKWGGEAFVFLLAGFFVLMVFLAAVSRGWWNWLKVDHRKLYSPTALWAFHLQDSAEHKFWFFLSIMLFDIKQDLRRFQALLHFHSAVVGPERSFWESFYDLRQKGTLIKSSDRPVLGSRLSRKVSGGFRGWPWRAALLLSESFLHRVGGVYDRFHRLFLSYVLRYEWVSEYYAILWEDWRQASTWREFFYQDSYILDIWGSWKDYMTLRYGRHTLSEVGNSFIRLPWGPFSDLIYYLRVFPIYFRSFNQPSYMEALASLYWIDMQESLSTQSWLNLNAVQLRESLIEAPEYQNYDMFRDFVRGSEEYALLAQSQFFSLYYHDYILLNGWDFFENSLWRWDLSTRALGVRENYGVDHSDTVEEEERAPALHYGHYVFWTVDLFHYDSALLDDYIYGKLTSDLQILTWSLAYSLPRADAPSWVQTMIEKGGMEEDIPEYLKVGKLEPVAEEAIDELEAPLWHVDSYRYEDHFWQALIGFLHWWDKRWANYNLPSWLMHKDDSIFELRRHDTLWGNDLLNNHDFGAFFPMFFYWIVVVPYALMNFWCWQYALFLMPWLKFFIGYFLLTVAFWKYGAEWALWDMVFYAQNPRQWVYWEPEVYPFLDFFMDEDWVELSVEPLRSAAFARNWSTDMVGFISAHVKVFATTGLAQGVMLYRHEALLMFFLMMLAYVSQREGHESYALFRFLGTIYAYRERSHYWSKAKIIWKRRQYDSASQI